MPDRERRKVVLSHFYPLLFIITPRKYIEFLRQNDNISAKLLSFVGRPVDEGPVFIGRQLNFLVYSFFIGQWAKTCLQVKRTTLLRSLSRF